VFLLCDYNVWIDTERGEEAKNHIRRMVELNLMEEEFCARWTAERRRVVFFASVRWIVRSIKRSGRRRGHESVRKHDV
jgi:hypothetical protein